MGRVTSVEVVEAGRLGDWKLAPGELKDTFVDVEKTIQQSGNRPFARWLTWTSYLVLVLTAHVFFNNTALATGADIYPKNRSETSINNIDPSYAMQARQTTMVAKPIHSGKSEAAFVLRPTR